MLSRIGRAQGRYDIDVAVAFAQALPVSPLVLLHGAEHPVTSFRPTPSTEHARQS
ncbi:hypothetical protein [Streptomyces sp. NBC_01217]|uniref:hypothetical protein n=1 Tax=Streptomyces sp. NBC_01217 TaxID=2903779 RepID=UPI002E10D217